jgi:hypothetical protein
MVIETGVLDDFISLNLQSLAIKGKRARTKLACEKGKRDVAGGAASRFVKGTVTVRLLNLHFDLLRF